MGKALELPENVRISIAESLYRVTSRTDGKGELLGLCPVHGEKNASFSYNYKTDVYFCQACRASGDLVKLWILVKGFSNFKEGFVSFCREYGLGGNNPRADFRIPDKKKEAPVENKKQVKDLGGIFRQMPSLPDEWVRTLGAERGWSEEVIRKHDLRLQMLYKAKNGPIKNITWKPNKIVIPIHDESGKIVNMRIYRPGPAMNEKDPKIFSWEFGTGEARLFPAKPEADGFILFCEGEPDTLCALSYGYNAITQTSKPKKWSKEHLEHFRDRDVVIAFDADIAGQIYAREFAAPALVKVARSVRLLEWPDYMGRLNSGEWPNDHGQDLTDFFVKHRKGRGDLDELIAEAKPYTKEHSINDESLAFYEVGKDGHLNFKSRLLADRLVNEFDPLYDPVTGLLYIWNGKRWEELNESELEKTAVVLLGKEARRERVKDAVYQAKMLATIPTRRRPDDMTDWICIQDGMFNIRTYELKPHDKDFYATMELPVVYNPDSQKICERWLQFLKETIQHPSVIAQVQEYMGYCLTRETFAEKALLLLGDGGNGKSRFLNVLRKLVGEKNTVAIPIPELNTPQGRGCLFGKLVNVCGETQTSGALDSTWFKFIVSGDDINGKYLYHDIFSFKPFCKMVFAINKMPKILDNTDGFFRKILPVQFKAKFTSKNADVFLDQKLEAELSEIFQWALVGLHRLREQGHFTEAQETDDLILEQRGDNNPVLCFVEEICDLNDAYSIRKNDLYKAYREYCFGRGYNPLGERNFFQELYIVKEKQIRAYRPEINKVREQHVKGVSLKTEAA